MLNLAQNRCATPFLPTLHPRAADRGQTLYEERGALIDALVSCDGDADRASDLSHMPRRPSLGLYPAGLESDMARVTPNISGHNDEMVS
ncbi:hypothetical protein GOACH_07_01680 [Gordonia aichiensis NBRC 108223]|uniref:Uncharacterized protein n=1 Tax=Gordonia aichiensis NBRC 108223 TaxID=1220583 RepID=L7KLP9_9ACTN|nr:hypothetical protein GOACH_07_01680 [Gordonia aichiensis NBRC 108223]